MSFKLSQKRTVKSYFEETTSFDVFHLLTYMSAIAGAGVTRAKVFQLSRELKCPPAQYLGTIHRAAEHLRYNYPDAVQMVGEQAEPEVTRSFLLRLSDALRSGEPLPGFLRREAHVQGENYSNEYTRQLESLKKWVDAYTAVTVSVALVVIINMVSTMIYSVGMPAMVLMSGVAIFAAFSVAWVLFRAGPQEQTTLSLARGSKQQRQSRRMFFISLPVLLVLCAILLYFKVDKGWILIVAGIVLAPVGWVSAQSDKATTHKGAEISSFLRSIGGTASSRATTLKDALSTMKIDSFPNLRPDIRKLDLRLKAFGKPEVCWRLFGQDSGSCLAQQAVSIFLEAVNLGSDPEGAGELTSAFAQKTAMHREQRRGVAATFSWLTIIMHVILASLMVFLLGILQQFGIKLSEAMSTLGDSSRAQSSLGLGSMFTFSSAQVDYLMTVTFILVVLLAEVNSFAIVAAEGTHLIKMTLFSSIMLVASGICFLTVPPLVRLVM